MALRNILTDGDELLRKTSREVTVFDGRLAQLLDDMWETMEDASGVGLAAPQVGVLRRAVVIDVTPPPSAENRGAGGESGADGEGPDSADEASRSGLSRVELVNPVIVDSEGEVSDSEGCLSVPGISGVVRRPERVKVTAFDRDGNEITVEGEGMLARAIGHEVDHLNGILFTDIADSLEEPD